MFSESLSTNKWKLQMVQTSSVVLIASTWTVFRMTCALKTSSGGLHLFPPTWLNIMNKMYKRKSSALRVDFFLHSPYNFSNLWTNLLLPLNYQKLMLQKFRSAAIAVCNNTWNEKEADVQLMSIGWWCPHPQNCLRDDSLNCQQHFGKHCYLLRSSNLLWYYPHHQNLDCFVPVG